MEQETPEQALARIQDGASNNDVAVIQAFYERGIHPEDIDPRENVLTFRAWKAKGRRVARGATSVRVTTWIPVDKANGKAEQDKKRGRMMPKTACVFHISQTVAEDAPKGERPAAWNNPQLVKPGTYDDEGADNQDRPEPNKVYSLSDIARGKSWSDAEVSA